MKDHTSIGISLPFLHRKEAENESAPPLAVMNKDSDSSAHPKYPYLYVREESLAQAAMRNRGKPLVAPSHPADARKTANA